MWGFDSLLSYNKNEMKTILKDLGKLKRKLIVTIPVDSIQESLSKIYQEFQQKVSIKGFRKGKIPKNILEKKFQENIDLEAKQQIIPKFLKQAIEKHSLKLATQPKIEADKIEKNKLFVFKAIFEVFPNFKLPKWEEVVSLKEKKIDLKKQEIENYANLLVLQKYQYQEKKSPVIDKDKVEIIINIKKINKKDEERKVSIVYYVGSFELSVDFDKALLKMEPKQKKELQFKVSEYSLSKDIANKNLLVEVEVLNIQQRIEREKDKIFYQSIHSSISDEKSLFIFAKESLLKMRKKQNEQKDESKIREAIIKNVSFEVPEEFIVNDLERMKQQKTTKNEKELEKMLIDDYRYQLVLKEIIEKENIFVTQEEFRAAFTELAYSYNKNPEELIKNPHINNIIKEIEQNLKERKSLHFIRDQLLQ